MHRKAKTTYLNIQTRGKCTITHYVFLVTNHPSRMKANHPLHPLALTCPVIPVMRAILFSLFVAMTDYYCW